MTTRPSRKPGLVLLLDIGNSTLHFGIARGADVIWHANVATEAGRFRIPRIPGVGKDECFAGASIASVVPPLTQFFAQMARDDLGVKALVISHRIKTGLKLNYRPPSGLGADRIANAIAAHARYPGDTIVVDMGTATTLEVIHQGGVFDGGAILPGLPLMVSALAEHTARLREVPVARPKHALADNTAGGIQSGSFHTHFAGINRLIALFTQETGRKYRIIATGGLSPKFGRHIDGLHNIDPLLTLQGVAIAFQLNERNHG